MRLVLENYRCFRQASVDFSPLTVIVGANASGKSTLVRALDPGTVDRLSDADAWQGKRERTIGIELTRRNQGRSVEWVPTRGPRLVRADPISFQVLRLDATQLRKQNSSMLSTRLASDGANLTSVFDSLSREEQAELSKQFCALVPVFGDVNSRPSTTSGQRQLLFQDRWSPTRWYEATEVSDGTMFTLAFLLLSKQQPPVDILAIEDPEHGLHPFLLGEVIGLLRRLANGELTERRINVVLTTHSPTVLEFVQPEEVRLLQRQDDGSVTIETIPTDSDHWRAAFKVYDESLGQAWLSGGLGGTP